MLVPRVKVEMFELPYDFDYLLPTQKILEKKPEKPFKVFSDWSQEGEGFKGISHTSKGH